MLSLTLMSDPPTVPSLACTQEGKKYTLKDALSEGSALLQTISAKSKEYHASKSWATFQQQWPPSLCLFSSSIFYLSITAMPAVFTFSAIRPFSLLVQVFQFKRAHSLFHTHLVPRIVGNPVVAAPLPCHPPSPVPLRGARERG